MADSLQTVNANVKKLRALLPKLQRVAPVGQQSFVTQSATLLSETEKLLANGRTDEAGAKFGEAWDVVFPIVDQSIDLLMERFKQQR